MRKLKRFYRRYQSFFITSSMFVLSIGMILIGIIPVTQKSLDMWQQIGTLKESVQKLSDKAHKLDAIDEVESSKQLIDLVAALPTNKSVQTIFGTTESIISKSGASLLTLTIQAPGSLSSSSAVVKGNDRFNGAGVMQFQITSRGNFDQFVSLLKSLQASRRLLRIKTLELSIDQKGLAAMNFAMEAFYRPLANTTASVESPLVELTSHDLDTIKLIRTFPRLTQASEVVQPKLNTSGRFDPFAL